MDDMIYKIYITLFWRAPEKEGVNYWYKFYIQNGFNLKELINSMTQVASNYGQYSFYKDLNDYNNIKTIIENIYQTLFNKTYEDDPEGIEYWTNEILTKHDFENVILDIIKVAEEIANKEIESDEKTYNAAVAFENKIDVSKYVSEKYETFDGNFSKFQFFISNVDYTPQSIEETITYINEYTKKQITYNDLSLGAKSLLYNQEAKIQKDIITYSFPQTMPPEYSQYPQTSDNWEPLNETDKEKVKKAFEELSSFLNVTFKEVESDGDIRFSKVNTSSNELGFTEMIINDQEVITTGIGSDVFLSLDYDKNQNAQDIILHELGHALGLKHPFEGDIILTQNDNSLYTIMSYTQVETYLPNIQIEKSSTSITYTLDLAPLGRNKYATYDIEALIYLYGRKYDNLTDSIYNLSNLYNNYQFSDILDNGGIDTLYFSNTSLDTKIFLQGGDNLSSIGSILPQDYIKTQIQQQINNQDMQETLFNDIIETINKNTDYKSYIYQGDKVITLDKNEIENVICGSGNDVVEDNSLDNIILGNDGDDTIIITYGGNDFIDGGEGEDTLKIYLNSPYEEYEKNDTTYLVFENSVVAFQNIEHVYVI